MCHHVIMRTSDGAGKGVRDILSWAPKKGRGDILLRVPQILLVCQYGVQIADNEAVVQSKPYPGPAQPHLSGHHHVLQLCDDVTVSHHRDQVPERLNNDQPKL